MTERAELPMPDEDLINLVDTLIEDALRERGIEGGGASLEERRRLTCLQYAHSFYCGRVDAGLAEVLTAATMFEDFLLGQTKGTVQ